MSSNSSSCPPTVWYKDKTRFRSSNNTWLPVIIGAEPQVPKCIDRETLSPRSDTTADQGAKCAVHLIDRSGTEVNLRQFIALRTGKRMTIDIIGVGTKPCQWIFPGNDVGFEIGQAVKTSNKSL